VIKLASESSKGGKSVVFLSVRDEPPRGIGDERRDQGKEYWDDEEKGKRNLITMSSGDC
jgi:hypothetical protein